MVRSVFKAKARMQLVTSDRIYLNFTFPSSGETGRIVQQKSRAHTQSVFGLQQRSYSGLMRKTSLIRLYSSCLQQQQVPTCHFDCEGDSTPQYTTKNGVFARHFREYYRSKDETERVTGGKEDIIGNPSWETQTVSWINQNTAMLGYRSF